MHRAAIARLSPIADLAAARRQPWALRATAHRPSPLPDGPWVMGQSWARLLFAHWRVPAEALRRTVPESVPLDERDGSAWLAITPFVVRGLRARGLPPAPFAGRFAELNVRTYTTIDGRPGIYFLSLDAASRLAVAGARRLYRLPYFHARMSVHETGGRIEYRSRRACADAPNAVLRAEYGPTGPAFEALPGTLEHFLTERYCLFTVDGRGRLRRTDIHHGPWRLHPASATIHENTMAASHGLDLGGPPALLHFAAPQDVVVWPPRRQRPIGG
jgi:uncharacterized protein